jgi:hypothetical protein
MKSFKTISQPSIGSLVELEYRMPQQPSSEWPYFARVQHRQPLQILIASSMPLFKATLITVKEVFQVSGRD